MLNSFSMLHISSLHLSDRFRRLFIVNYHEKCVTIWSILYNQPKLNDFNVVLVIMASLNISAPSSLILFPFHSFILIESFLLVYIYTSQLQFCQCAVSLQSLTYHSGSFFFDTTSCSFICMYNSLMNHCSFPSLSLSRFRFNEINVVLLFNASDINPAPSFLIPLPDNSQQSWNVILLLKIVLLHSRSNKVNVVFVLNASHIDFTPSFPILSTNYVSHCLKGDWLIVFSETRQVQFTQGLVYHQCLTDHCCSFVSNCTLWSSLYRIE